MKGDGSSPHQRRDSVSKRLGNLPRSQAPKCLMQDVNSRLSEFFPLAILTPKSWCRAMNIISQFYGTDEQTDQASWTQFRPATYCFRGKRWRQGRHRWSVGGARPGETRRSWVESLRVGLRTGWEVQLEELPGKTRKTLWATLKNDFRLSA